MKPPSSLRNLRSFCKELDSDHNQAVRIAYDWHLVWLIAFAFVLLAVCVLLMLTLPVQARWQHHALIATLTLGVGAVLGAGGIRWLSPAVSKQWVDMPSEADRDHFYDQACVYGAPADLVPAARPVFNADLLLLRQWLLDQKRPTGGILLNRFFAWLTALAR